MHLTLEELREIKHKLPSGSINSGNHLQAGPHGGIVEIQDETILNLAKKILEENSIALSN